jgi:hypothetical protein
MRLLLVRPMRALAFTMFLGFSGSAFAGVFGSYSAIGKMDEKHYQFKVSQADILRTSIWAAGADFPPLSARKAQEIARREMRELLGTGKQQWELRETTIVDMGDGMHFVYVIHFEPASDGQACTMCDFMPILVLMDGTVPKPIVKPLSP